MTDEEPNRNKEYDLRTRSIKRKKKRLANIIREASEHLNDNSLARDEKVQLFARVIYKHQGKVQQLERLMDDGRPPRAFANSHINAEDLGLGNEEVHKQTLRYLREGRARVLPYQDDVKRQDKVYNDEGEYIRTGGRGTTRAEGRRIPEVGEKRAYDHFLRETELAREHGGAHERTLTNQDMRSHDLETLKRNGEYFPSYIKSHVLYPSKNEDHKKCKYGTFKDKDGDVQCIKNPVHYKPGSNHHLVTGAGAGYPAAEEDYGGGGGFEDGGNEPEPAPTARRVKKTKERRSSRISKLKEADNYWERKNTRRKLNRT